MWKETKDLPDENNTELKCSPNNFISLHCKGNTLFVTKDCFSKKAVTYLKNPNADLGLI